MRSQINTAIARLANRRKGLVTREQLLDAGFSRGQIDTRVQSKALIPEYEGIYRIGHCAPALETSYLAAVLACGEGALLSELERGFIALLRQHNLPLPKTNIPKDGHWVDCRWSEHKLTVELDSYQFHSTRHAWQQDYERERKARKRGDTYRRYIWGD